jgi:hypothetical protein
MGQPVLSPESERVAWVTPALSTYDNPACLPSASGSHPRKWSKLRFSIVTTTICSMPEFCGLGRLGKFRRKSCANDFLLEGHDAPTNAAPETNAAFFNNSRRFTFMMSLPDLDDLHFGLFQQQPESTSRLGIARSRIGQG